jgi:hypothetical protein
MTANRNVVVAAAFLASAFYLAPAPAHAQQRAASGFAHPAAIHARPVTSRPVGTHAPAVRSSAPRPTIVHFNAARNSFETNDRTRVAFQDLLNSSAGAGFNFGHLAVINPNSAVRASIDPDAGWRFGGPQRFRRGSRFVPSLIIWPGGYDYPVADESGAPSDQGAESDQPSQQQQDNAEEEEPAAQQQEQNSYAEEQPPLPDVGQFTLVLQDGQQLQAVAFTHIDDKIVYITTDGSRRTVAASDLDPDATVRINEERGTALQLPL